MLLLRFFSSRYLRSSDAIDVARLLQIDERRGFLGVLDSLDCMFRK